MKKWMCICAIAVLTVSTLTRYDASTGAATIVTRTETSKGETSKAEMTKKETTRTSEASEEAGDTTSEEIRAATGKHHVKTNVEDYGAIPVELYGNETPITVANFLKLAEDGLYDGLTFHRIISGFMIRDDDPLSTDTGDPDQEIKGESSNNGVEDPLSRTRGAISIAYSQIRGSASPQFFVVYEDSTFLDGGCVCFGYVTEGIEVVNAICEDIRVEDNSGSVAKASQLIIESIEVVGW